MKLILLTTTALTMTAGIAAADVSVSGSFKLGFNDTDSNSAATGTAAVAPVIAVDPITGARTVTTTGSAAGTGTNAPVAASTTDNNYGVYNDAGITFAMSSTMDSGMTAGITVDMNGGDTTNNAVDSYTLALASDGLNVTFGTTEYSAITNWTSAGDMGTDTWANQNADNLNVLRADATVGGLAISAAASLTTGAKASPNPVSITVGGSLGGASYVIASEGSKMGIAVTTAAGGATVTTAYSTAPTLLAGVEVAGKTSTSTGVKIAYPMGAITTTASYVMESVGTGGTAMVDAWNIAAVYSAGTTKVTFKTDEATNNSVEGSAALGAATLYAGLEDNLEDMYVGISNPLGGGATIMASYAIDADGSGVAGDDIGAPEYQEGLTVELKFAF
jgi:hypothetical protein